MKITFKMVLQWLALTLLIGYMCMAIIGNRSLINYVLNTWTALSPQDRVAPWSHLFTEVEQTKSDLYLTDDDEQRVPVRILTGPRGHTWMQVGNPALRGVFRRETIVRLCVDTSDECTSHAFKDADDEN